MECLPDFSASFPSEEVLGSQTGIPKGLKKPQKFQRGGGVNDKIIGIQRPGTEHFRISVEGVKCPCCPW